MSVKVSNFIQKVAILDIGSNSVKLLIVELVEGKEPRILLEKSATTRLGEGIQHRFQLHENAMQRTLDALYDFKREGEKFGVDIWKAIATSALRDAVNRHEFEKRFCKKMGFSLRVLSGQEEARLIYQGAMSNQNLFNPHDDLLVMDSGGGSAEWILGKGQKIQKAISLDLGCVRMTQRFLRGDPYTEDSYHELLAYYEERLGFLKSDFAKKGLKMIGTGGSICTAAALDMEVSSAHDHHVHGYTLNLGSLSSLVERLRKMKNAERLKLKGLSPKRADIIVAGLALFVTAMQIFGIKKLKVSLRGLRYGALIDDRE